MLKSSNYLNILVIDDDPVYRNLLQSILGEKVNVFTVKLPSQAFKLLKNEEIDIVICDFRLPEMNGLQVIDKIKDLYPDIEIILISSVGDMDTVIAALRKGVTDYFKKPFSAAEIWMAIERTNKFARLRSDLIHYKKKNTQLKEEITQVRGQSIIGNSGQLKSIRTQMQLVANTPDTSVLIIGESGTGKELVARGIHAMSHRKNEMFGAVNMSAVPEALFESEFFGHKKGSFTGAIADKAGWFEAANKGTLFFDEIGEMSTSLQVKLLRVLEDRKFTKIGSQNGQNFDIRIVSATNKNHDELSNGKNFRLDLFHRLGTFIIEMPPLREIKDDIPEMANYFVNILANKMGRKINSIHSEVFDMLSQYSFPGNIRELRNLLERAIIICPSDQLLPKHFNLLVNNRTQQTDNLVQENEFDLNELEKQTIIKALKKVNNNKAAAAKLLNLEWNALFRRLKKFGIDTSDKPL